MILLDALKIEDDADTPRCILTIAVFSTTKATPKKSSSTIRNDTTPNFDCLPLSWAPRLNDHVHEGRFALVTMRSQKMLFDPLRVRGEDDEAIGELARSWLETIVEHSRHIAGCDVEPHGRIMRKAAERQDAGFLLLRLGGGRHVADGAFARSVDRRLTGW